MPWGKVVPQHNFHGDVLPRGLLAFAGELHQMTSLHLDLRSHRVGDWGMTNLAAALGQLHQVACLHLGLYFNGVGDVGTKHLAAALGGIRCSIWHVWGP